MRPGAATPAILLALLHMIAYSAMRPVVSLRAAELGATHFQVGLIFAAHNLVQLLLALVAGMAADRWSYRRLALASSVLYVLGIAGTALSPTWWLIGLAQVATGSAHIAVQVAYQAQVAALPNRQHSIGLLTFAISAAQGVGPSASGVLADAWGMVPALWACTVAAVAALASSWWMPAAGGATHAGERTAGWTSVLREPELLRAVAVSTMVLFALDVLATYFPLYGQEVGLSATVIGLVLTMRAVASMLPRPFMGVLSDRWGRERVLGASVVLGGLSLCLFGLAPSPWVLVPVSALVGLTLGLAQPLTLLTVSELARPELLGSAMSFRLMGNRLGQTVSPILFGLASGVWGLAAVFWLSGSILAASYPVLRTARRG